MSDADASLPTMLKSAPAKPAPALTLLPEEHRDIHVLLAEDNPVNQKVALRQLHKLGFKADAVGNGLEVLDALKRIPYDIILMDCQMPDMDGYEATRRIRDREKSLPHSPDFLPRYVIALTANALQGDREKCLKSGMNDYISKPVQLNDIQSALARAIEVIRPGKRAGAAAPLPVAAVLDPAALAGLRELQMPGEPDPVVELIDLFLQDAPPRWQVLEEALAQRNLQALEATSHSLKGSAGNLGARKLSSLFAEIEKLSRSGTTVESAYPLAQAKEEFQKVIQALETEKASTLARGPNPS
jgi:two-component system sensor histidine kinase/response regulator